MIRLSADAFPVGMYYSDRPILPEQIRVDVTDEAFVLWVAGLSAGVSREGDESKLHAALVLADKLTRTGQQLDKLLRDELAKRARERQAESAAAAFATMRAADVGRPPYNGAPRPQPQP
ncbi:hypothetical protein, partial [Nonomuraea aridisoli]